MIFLLVAGIVFLLAGAASILFGVPVKEFSFGNTLILSGVLGGCTGAILVGLSFVAREVRALAVVTAAAGAAAQRPAGKSSSVVPAAATETDSESGLLFPGDRSEREVAPSPADVPAPSSGPAPWQDEPPPRDRLRSRPIETPPAPPPTESEPKKRNLLFSTSRRDRDRAGRANGTDGDDATKPGSVLSQGVTRSFDEAWPDADRPRADAGARRRRSLLGGGEETAEPAAPEPERPRLPEPSPAPRSEEMTEVTVLKSGVVDGMAYSLYSDGSIEAQMPEGMMRFESIDALREHLDQRG
ncbi:hypothetical protein [Rhodopseudomonas telluris]|uniref:DUF308 domain-containing protein n=1 Tax=Rhodopseudomonas telluris TaxID=644215 RepID=A0ABV6ET70_9BRAD